MFDYLNQDNVWSVIAKLISEDSFYSVLGLTN